MALLLGSGANLATFFALPHGIVGGEFSFGAWIYPTAWTADSVILDNEPLDPLFYVASSGIVQTYFGGAGVGYNTAISLNVWTHVGIMRKGDTGYVFINGVQESTTANWASKTYGTHILRAGADSAGGGDGFDGRLAEFCLWRRKAIGVAGFRDLARGVNPNDIPATAAQRFGYWPMRGGPNYAREEWNGYHMRSAHASAVPVIAPHPFVMPPRTKVRRSGRNSVAGGAPSAGTITSMLPMMGVG